MSMQALRARRIIPLSDEKASRGSELFRPLRIFDDGLLVLHHDRVLYAGAYAARHVPTGVPVRDLGDVTLVPAAVNAHTHIQLSHLAGRTLWGQGFVPWLRSLIPLLALPLEVQAVRQAVQDMRPHTAHVGDYTSHGMALVAEALLAQGMSGSLLAECFGFALPEDTELSAPPNVWPPRCRDALGLVPASPLLDCAPVGHALYSTHERLLRTAHAWCVGRQLPFAMHLAEFPEEEELLVHGRGALVDLYRQAVLPPQWRAPGLPPVRLAESWALLGPHTVAVHGVHCTAEDVALLSKTGTALCLCPRSNKNLAVGTAPAAALAEAGVLLCLGTDGLSSNSDLNVWQEALVLLQEDVLPAQALLRMLCCNGAAALRRGDVGTLLPGRRACWAVLPPLLEQCLGAFPCSLL